jgi:mannitol-1-phosphate 5-dehydrogenase
VRAVVIGPGRIGLGFAADLLDRAGAKLTVVGRGDVVDNLEDTGGYRVRLIDQARQQEREIRVRRALHADDMDAVSDQLARARVVAVAVRPENLGAVAPLIAAGLKARTRKKPLNVIAFENAVDAGPALRAAVAELLPSEFPLKRHGFSGAVVSRAVSGMLGEPRDGEPLTVLGDPLIRFEVHGPSLAKSMPKIPGLVRVDDFEAAFNAKLYVFSAGHATVAYLGFLKGYRYIHAAVRDPEIRAAALEAMQEGQEGLAARYGRKRAGGEAELEAILWRFENAALGDPVTRVGRDPRRKLEPSERLAGAAKLFEKKAGRPPSTLPMAAAAAVCFAAVGGDPGAATATAEQLSQGSSLLRELGTAKTDPAFAESVTVAWERFSTAWRRDSPLYTLSSDGS